MAENNNDFEKDLEYIKAQFDENKAPVLPEKLGKEAITELVKNEKQNKNTARYVRYAISAAAVFVLIIAAVFVSGNLNKKPNELTQQASTDGIAQADNYDSIVDLIADYKKEHRSSGGIFDGMFNYGTSSKGDTAEAVNESEVAAATDTASINGGASDDSSELNTRVQGVDEGDIVRTDGTYLYVSNGYYGRVFVIKPDSDGSMTVVSVINTENDCCGDGNYWFNQQEMYVRDGKLIVSVSMENYDEEKGETAGMLIYDITDAASPVLVKKFSQSGSYLSSRITDGKLLIISEYWVGDSRKYTEENCIPAVYGDENAKTLVGCGDIFIPDTDEPDRYNVITLVNLSDLSAEPVTKAILGDGWETYCTSDILFIYGSDWDSETGDTIMDIKAFSITDTIEYKGCCRLTGWFYNSFSMDWDGQYLRVAVHADDTNKIYIYNGDFELVGKLDSFGEGEQIYGIRFIGNTAYAVTFYRTDPLFVIDLSDPTAPVVSGELKMPGFSDYLHPVGDGLVLGIGSGGDDDGLDGSAKISLYDVADPANPTELSSVIIPDAGIHTEYKAFVTVPGESSYIIPVSMYNFGSENTEDEYSWSGDSKTGSVKVTVSEDRKLVLSAQYLADAYGDDYIYIERSVVINGNVFNVDLSNGVFSYSPDGTQLSTLSFREYLPENTEVGYDYDVVYSESPPGYNPAE